jgi:signal transduction histidine kinase
VRRPIRRWLTGWIVSVALVAAVSGALALLGKTAQGVAVLYLFAVLPVAIVWGASFGLLVSAAGTAAYDLFFVAPTYSLVPSDPRNWLRLGGFLAAAVVVSQLAGRWRESARLAAEQAAVRRVATLIAHAAPPADVFAAVAEEVGRLLLVDRAFVARYESDDTVTIVGGWNATGEAVTAVRRPFGSGTLSALVRKTGRPARIDHHPEDREAGLVPERSGVAAPITVQGRLWGLIRVASNSKEPPPETEARLAHFTELVGTAIANANAQAELTASRARIVASADETRHKIQRDLHDGAQQRVVAVELRLKALASSDAAHARGLDADLLDLAADLGEVLQELRDISAGLHPAVLSKGGLEAALKALARRSPMPVALDVRVSQRLSERLEIAAYYIVAEILTNAVKHSNGSHVQVTIEAIDGTLRVCVGDDGVGGADPKGGSGLVGLRDRIEALGGMMTIDSPPGGGTTLLAKLPLGHTADRAEQPQAL